MEYEGTFWCVIGQMGSLPGEQGRFRFCSFCNQKKLMNCLVNCGLWGYEFPG